MELSTTASNFEPIILTPVVIINQFLGGHQLTLMGNI
jgi:hypothetical protein